MSKIHGILLMHFAQLAVAVVHLLEKLTVESSASTSFTYRARHIDRPLTSNQYCRPPSGSSRQFPNFRSFCWRFRASIESRTTRLDYPIVAVSSVLQRVYASPQTRSPDPSRASSSVNARQRHGFVSAHVNETARDVRIQYPTLIVRQATTQNEQGDKFDDSHLRRPSAQSQASAAIVRHSSRRPSGIWSRLSALSRIVLEFATFSPSAAPDNGRARRADFARHLRSNAGHHV